MISDFYSHKFPTLELDNNFLLREHVAEDTLAFFQYYTDPEVAKYILATNPKTIDEAHAEIMYCRNLFYQKMGIYWSIVRKDNNQMIGAIGLYINNHHHRAEICYDLSRDYWGQGITTKAIRKVLAFSFNHIGVNRVEALTMKENDPSRALLLKTGFIHEGTLANYRYFQNESHDVEMYGVTQQMLPKTAFRAENVRPVISKI